jgi:hypothetical protein
MFGAFFFLPDSSCTPLPRSDKGHALPPDRCLSSASVQVTVAVRDRKCGVRQRISSFAPNGRTLGASRHVHFQPGKSRYKTVRDPKCIRKVAISGDHADKEKTRQLPAGFLNQL